jgi:hypothetical protein
MHMVGFPRLLPGPIFMIAFSQQIFFHPGTVRTKFALLMPFAGSLLALFPAQVGAWLPGTYPAAPARMHSSGFSVNNQDRNDVVAFWHAVYQASEGYEQRIGWTGNYTGTPGQTSAEFARDVERRLNYFRAMCGVPANVTVNSNARVVISPAQPHQPPDTVSKKDAAQATALMLILNYNPTTGANSAFSHDPNPAVIGWSKAAWNAAAHGNLSFGSYGPGAISEYLIEELSAGSSTSAWNSLVGHRRWALFPKATTFASGDQPGSSASRPPTNALYVIQSSSELKADPTPGFVAYPAPGFFPAPLNSRFWSFSLAGADFSSAKVAVSDASGKRIQVARVASSTSYGDPALLFEVSGLAAARSVVADATFKVKVTGIKGTGLPKTADYSVTLINPNLIVWNQQISGPAVIPPGKETVHVFSPPANAEALAVTTFLKRPVTWIENAETPAGTKVIDRTSTSYPLIANGSLFPGFGAIAGNRSFNLTFPNNYDLLLRGVATQILEIDRDILSGPKAELRFLYRRGYMTPASSMAVEYSNDWGVTWKALGRPIVGLSSMFYDTDVSAAALALPESDKPLRIRFRYFTEPNTSIYTHDAAPTSPTGIFIDDITTTNCNWLEPKRSTTLQKNASQFRLNSRSAGGKLEKGSEWFIGLRIKLGGKWFPAGSLKKVVVGNP